MTPPWRFGILTLLWLAGCSDYVGYYQYTPRPAMTDLHSTSTTRPAPVTSAMASVIGVRKQDRKLGIPTSVEVRLRIDDIGPEPVSFDPRTLELTNGALVTFPPPVVRPNQTLSLTPSQSAVVTAYFPFPPGRSYDNIDMDGLQLRWLLQIAGQSVRQSVLFNRLYPAYYYYPDPYWGYPADYPPYGPPGPGPGGPPGGPGPVGPPPGGPGPRGHP